MARSLTSLGRDSALALFTARRRRAFIAGSGRPAVAATVISRESVENSLERALSARPLRCMMFLNLECPAMVRRSLDGRVRRKRALLLALAGAVRIPCDARGLAGACAMGLGAWLEADHERAAYGRRGSRRCGVGAERRTGPLDGTWAATGWPGRHVARRDRRVRHGGRRAAGGAGALGLAEPRAGRRGPGAGPAGLGVP